MCGATSAQTNLQTEQLQAYQQAKQMTAEEYANQQAIFAPMAKQFESIFALGPSQEGFSQAEENTLTDQAITGTATNYQSAARALGEQEAAIGGGDAYMPSGGATQLKEELATSAAQSESQQETQVKEADFATGRSDWQAAGEGLMSIAAGENPTAYENAATSAGGAASTTANEVAQEQNSWVNAALGAAGSIGGGFAGDFNFGSEQ